MSCSQDSVPLARPGTEKVLVTELTGSSQMNSTSAAYEDSDMLVELYLSPEKLVPTCPSCCSCGINNSMITSVRCSMWPIPVCRT
ncbi:hypothetical protein J4Q44_G00091980 [Coregonus suidteri]|uniref:Uncharacterized protein n=1 Tax=Coregonus suidteri TaxID=861788 RepID=A0AAN8R0X7_9TELE